MMWEKTTIGKHCTVTSSKRFHLSDRSDSGIPFYCSKEIIQKVNGQEITDYDYIKVESYEEVKKKFGVPECGDLLITTRGTYGVPYLYNAEDKFYFADGNLTWLKDFDDLLVAEFLYYWILSYEGQKKIDAIAKGTAQKAVPIALIKDIELSIPDVEMQKKIAKILTAYDDFIENNQKQIKLLEEVAQRLYKEWFVDLRFPGYEDVEIVDGVPEGWKKAKVTDFIEVKYGKDHKALANGNTPVYGSGGVMRYVKPILYSGESVLIPRKGSLNNILLVSGDFWTIDTMFFSIPKLKNVAKYTYLFLKGIDMYSFNIGAAVPSMTVKILGGIDILHPTDTVLEQFERIISPIFEMKTILERQIKEAEQARDRLLPKLMSGEIEV